MQQVFLSVSDRNTFCMINTKEEDGSCPLLLLWWFTSARAGQEGAT